LGHGENRVELFVAERASPHARARRPARGLGRTRDLAQRPGRRPAWAASESGSQHQRGRRDRWRQTSGRTGCETGLRTRQVLGASCWGARWLVPAARRRAAMAIGLACAMGACGPRAGRSEQLEAAYRANNRGVALLEQFDYGPAVEAFRDALARDPSMRLAR